MEYYRDAKDINQVSTRDTQEKLKPIAGTRKVVVSWRSGSNLGISHHLPRVEGDRPSEGYKDEHVDPSTR
jgi:hypothetical protein